MTGQQHINNIKYTFSYTERAGARCSVNKPLRYSYYHPKYHSLFFSTPRSSCRLKNRYSGAVIKMGT